MSLEVGRLVARLELKDDLTAGLGRAQSKMSATAKSAQEMDVAVGKAGKTGSNLTVSGQAAKQLEDTRSVAQRLDGQLGKVGLSLGALGAMAGIGGLAAGMSAIVKQGNELTDNLNTLRAAGGATDAQMAKVSATAKQLGADNEIVGASAGSAAAAMTELVKGGMNVDQSMQAARGTLQLAAAAQIDAAQAATIQSSALQSFSLSARDAGRVSDILANAANASSAEIGDVAQAMQQAGTVANQFGVDVDDTATAIAMFANAGIRGSDAGTLLKSALLALTDQGNPAQGAIEELGLTVYDLQGKFVGLPSLFEQLAAAQAKMSPEAYQAATATLFGADAMRLAGIAAQHGSEGFNKMNAAVNKVGGAAEMAAAKTRGLPGAINNLQNQAETAAVAIYELVDGPLASLANFAADKIEKVPDALSDIASAAAPVGNAVGNVFDAIPGQVTGALAALVALRVTGLGGALTSRIESTGGGLRNLGESIALQGMYAREAISTNGVFGASMQGVGKVAGGMKSALGGVVNMLGGPWMVGLAAAGMLVQDFVSSAMSAKQVNEQLAAASAESAAAQLDLAAALGAANGEMDEQAMAAAQRMVQAEFDKTSAKAGQNFNVFADLRSAINRTSYEYKDFAGAAETMGSAVGRSAAQTEMAKLEQQALRDATAEAGISMEEVNGVVARGGQQYGELAVALLRTGDAGAAVLADMNAVRAEIESTQQAVASAKDGSYELADAISTIADSASSAEEKTAAMRAALDALKGGTKSAADATQAHNENINKIAESTQAAWDATKGFGDALVKNGNQIDTTSENGQKLRDALNGLIDTTLQAKSSGSDMGEVWAANDQALKNLAESTGLPIEKIRELAEAEGLVKGNIDILASLQGGDQVVQDLARVSLELQGIEPGKSIEVKAASEDAIAQLREMGWQVDHVTGDKNMTVTASTEAARNGLAQVAVAAANVENADPNVDIATNAGFVQAALGVTADQVRGLPDGHVEITDTTPENMARLQALGIETRTDKTGRVIINDADVDRARGRVNELNKIETQSRHTVIIGTVNRGGNDVATDGITVGQHYGGRANGGIDGVERYADGGVRGIGTLPEQAVIQRPKGAAGMVQWAEAETGGEAFIPLAPSKRKRSLSIWEEVGRRLGALDPRPAASRIGNSIWNLAANRSYDGELSKFGIEEDNPLSRLGLAAFDARRGTNRAIAGLMPGLFGNHSPIGYNDGEFWLNKFADGGIMASGLINFAKGVEGKPYVWGGVNWGDCSGAVSALANYVSGRSPFGSRFATASQREGLLARGFVMGRGKPGDLRVGWKNGGPGGGHTSATLPNGVNFEMGGARGNGQYGGGAAGADDPQYTDHAHFPMERFADIDAALDEGAMSEIAALLGTGNPDMAPESDTRTQREKNIDAIVAEGQRRGMSDRDIQIALMTAEQESGIRVLNNPADAPSMAMAAEGTGYDGTSTGIFQQQNNGGWGTLEDRMDPTRSAGMFYDALAKVENRDQLSLTQAAQKVQGSAHPDAYAKHEGTAAELLSASKSRLASMSTGGTGAGGGKGLPVYVTNMPAGGFSGGGSGGGGGGVSSSGGGDAGDVIKEGSIADVLMRAAGLDPTTMFGEPALKGKEKRFDDTRIFEKEGDIEAAKEQARIAKVRVDELKNKRNAKGEPVAPTPSTLAAAELRAEEAERRVAKLEHDLHELRLKSQQVREHNASIGVDVENYADGGFHGLENHSAHIAPNGSYRIFGESETGGEAYIPLASHKRARSTAIWLETGRRLGYGIGAGINLVGSVLTGNGLDTGWGGPGLGDLGIDTNALKDSLAPGLNAEAEKAGQQVAAVLQAFLNDVQKGVSDTMRTVDDQQRQLRQQYARAMI